MARLNAPKLKKENSTVLLFIIGSTTRALASILDSTEYLCRGRITVLAVIDIEDGTEINGEAVSPSEKKDLNRARAYLRESAERHGVPCYSTIDGACAAVCKMFELDNAAAGGVQTQAMSSQQQQQQQYEAIDAAAIDSRRIRRTTTSV